MDSDAYLRETANLVYMSAFANNNPVSDFSPAKKEPTPWLIQFLKTTSKKS